MENDIEKVIDGSLLSDIRQIIAESRHAVFDGISIAQIEHNWKIGRRIVEEEQDGAKRAQYGAKTIAELSDRLCAEYGEGYSERNLREFRSFYLVFGENKIWHTRVPNLKKMDRVTHQDVGQMDMYVRMFDEIVKQPDDGPTIGIVLCAETDPDIARYSILKGNEQLFATKYKLKLPTPQELNDEVARQSAMLRLQFKASAKPRREGK